MRLPAIVFLLMLIMIIASPLQAWEKYTDEELTMSPPDWAPDATAMYLDHDLEGSIEQTHSGFEIDIAILMRIKIFDEEAIDEVADMELYVPEESKIKRFKARTITPDGDRIKVDKDDLHRVVGHDAYRVAFPGVTEGAILEMSYRWSSEEVYFLPPFSLSSANLASRESTVVLRIPGTLQYQTGLINVQGLDYNEDVEKVATATGWRLQYTAVVHDIPPAVDEVLCPDPAFSTPQVMFVMRGYTSPYSSFDLIKDWSSVASILDEFYAPYCEWSDDLDVFLKSHSPGPINEAALSTLFRFVADSVELVSREGVYGIDRSIDEVLAERRGTRLEKMLLIREICRHGGLEAEILLGQPANEGSMIRSLPVLSQFSSGIVRVYGKGTTVDLDPAFIGAPLGKIPWYLAGTTMFVVDPEDARFERMPSSIYPEGTFTSVNGTFTDEGALEADLSIVLTGPFAKARILSIKESDSENLAEVITDAWLPELDPENVSDIRVDINDDGEGQIDAHIQVENAAIPVEDSWVVKPNVFDVMDKDFLPDDDDRQTSLHFGAPYEHKLEVNYKLPGGCCYTDNPVTKIKKDRAFGFVVHAAAGPEPGTLRYSRHTQRKHWSFTRQAYDTIRDYYNELAEADRIELVAVPMEADTPEPEGSSVPPKSTSASEPAGSSDLIPVQEN